MNTLIQGQSCSGEGEKTQQSIKAQFEILA